MPTDDWERGYAAGYRAAHRTDVRDITSDRGESAPKPKRKVSDYHKRYGRAFKKLEPKYKLKNGKWGKNGFKRCAAAARKEAKR
tara:strand:+ start:958 stop:1209 length:252 start_codon:yes stop_codon:yes gene_type:complete